MKKRIITAAVMAFLMGGFCFTTSAGVVPTPNATVIFAGDNIDKLLDEYEKVINQYIKLYKKAMSGDMTAMNEYVKIAEKAQQLSEKISKAADKMTPAQKKRLASIADKMVKAIQ
jgi:predicted  nucleic acid-binding Zn-ribbon protein